jgi:hypothetical protein
LECTAVGDHGGKSNLRRLAGRFDSCCCSCKAWMPRPKLQFAAQPRCRPIPRTNDRKHQAIYP